jgi:superfamily I DNA/RNA helicase
MRDFMNELEFKGRREMDEEAEDGGGGGLVAGGLSMLYGNAGGVSIMTCHASKGLEFSAVYVASMNDEIFPWPAPRIRRNMAVIPFQRLQGSVIPQNAMRGDHQLEFYREESRVAHVALTRARSKLHLSFVRHMLKDTWNGQARLTKMSESVFLRMILDNELTWRRDTFQVEQAISMDYYARSRTEMVLLRNGDRIHQGSSLHILGVDFRNRDLMNGFLGEEAEEEEEEDILADELF